MKKNYFISRLLLIMLLCMTEVKAHAYDIAVRNADGVTIYYNYVNDGTGLEVTRNNSRNYGGSVVIPEEVTYNNQTMVVVGIGDYAFYSLQDVYGGKGPTSVTIPNTVTYLGVSSFEECRNLTSITIPNSVINIEEKVFYNCTSLSFVSIGNSVTSIGNFAFQNCTSLTSANIGNSVITIGRKSFYNCRSLTSITIPSSVTTIGDYTFGECVNLTSIDLGNSLKSIGDKLFYNCVSLSSITIPNSVKNIGNEAFFGCSVLSSVFIPNSVNSIGLSAFSCTPNLNSIVVDSNNPNYDSRNGCNAIIETSSNKLVSGCVNSIIIEGIKRIGVGAFRGCSGLVTINIPNSVTSIDDYAFSGCNMLASVFISNSLNRIESYAFQDCMSLTSMSIPKTVTYIGSRAFNGCSGLTSVITKMDSPCSIDETCFNENVYEHCTLYVPYGTTYKYKAKNYWSYFENILEGDPSEGSEQEKCAKPTISYNNGQLSFNTSTFGATCYYNITDNDVKSGSGDCLVLCVTYNINVYAYKSGYQNSDIATGTLCWIDTTPTTEGITGIAQIPANAVLIQANDGFISISGLDESKHIAIYQTDGKQVATAKAYNGNASVATNISRGTPVIVKIGEKAVKVVMQ